MTIAPTLSGGLKLVPEEEQDWLILLQIADDGDGNLAQQFSDLMDDDSMWEDIVVPELEVEFSEQRRKVVAAILQAREAEGDGVLVEKADAEAWYGALNQARLAMEAKYHFGPRELRDPSELEESEARSAYFRNEFYCTVQSLLLEYVMGDA
jgi:hypothetical protein